MNTDACSVVFTGDIGFDRYMAGRWEADDLLSAEILQFFHSAGHVVANVEGALIDAKDDGSRGQWFHCMNPAATRTLQMIHADIWNISNNHIMDAGPEGLISTCKIAAELGCHTIGAGINEEDAATPVILPEAGGIGLCGVAYMKECIPATETEPGVFRWDNMKKIASRIKEIKLKCRWCIIVVHGGEEFADLPNPYTRDRYIQYLKLGADAVVAHHPHVPENYETFADGKMIFYSLGNFIFDTDYQRAHPYTDTGVLLKLNFTSEKISFDAIGTHIVRGLEQVVKDRLPDIFTDIPAEEYAILSPLASQVFLNEEKKKMIYLEPERFHNADEDVWNSYFFSTEPDGYDAGAHMDLSVIVPHAQKAKEDSWKKSSLTPVLNYLLNRP